MRLCLPAILAEESSLQRIPRRTKAEARNNAARLDRNDFVEALVGQCLFRHWIELGALGRETAALKPGELLSEGGFDCLTATSS